MKMTWNRALAAMVVLGCVMSLSFAQPPAPLSPGPQDPGRSPSAVPPATAAPPTGFAVQPPAAGNEEGYTVVEVTSDGKVYKTLRTTGGGRYGGGWTYGAALNDPDMAKLYAAEEEAAKEAHGLIGKLKSITDEKEKADASKALRDALTKQFDAQQKRRAHEISKIEERLGKLKDTMKKRESAKDTIIGRRLDELTGVTDDLGWEETGVPARVRAIESNYGVPGVVPVPTAPRAYPAPGAGGGSLEPRR